MSCGKNGITSFKVKDTAKVQNVSECLSGRYLLNHRTFCHQTWYVYAAYHKPECHAKNLVHCVQCQGHSEGFQNQNITISGVSAKLLVGLRPNLVWFYSIISRIDLRKNWFTIFNAKVTARVYIIKILLCLLYTDCWSVCDQTWFDSTTS